MMILEFNNPHLSITELAQTELPDFTVLTGVNGSGKSHLLSAITSQSIRIQGMEQPRIVLFNYETFKLDNEPALNSHQLTSEKETAWQLYKQRIKNNAKSWRSGLGGDYEIVTQECVSSNIPFWEVKDSRIDPYRQHLENWFKQPNMKSNQQAQGIYSMAKRLPYGIDSIEHDDFLSLYKPFIVKNDFLPNQLGRVFWDYYIKYRQNQINEFEHEKYGKDYPFLSEDEFIRKHGEKPWDVVNRILEKINTVTYRVNSPEGEDVFGNFQLKLYHTEKKELQIDFNNLSSGEKVLMALVASVYKASADKIFPDVLLLDEVDASLHPSMMKNMLEVIDDVFLRQSVKVILVTHSPTTIALAPEDSIRVMNPSGAERIIKTTRQDALAILTQGYATLDEGLKLFDEIAHEKLTVITEGYNTSFLRKALELNGINGVNILDGLEAISGKTQLKTLFDFFTKAPHDNKVLFVWDCDVKYNKLTASNNTYPFIFEKNNENNLAKKGIENLFPSSLFSGMIKRTTLSQGDTIEEFDGSRKRDFEKLIMERNNPDDFKLFAPFIEKVKELVSK
ncbi:MAG: ATP-binding protein [Candidatus Electrothrix sp. AW1]|nr:ATP-binding protein [Candidatus Electrothrix sp. AX1]MCI5181729.1 ATP-binding protein [Candidatus Electrothrix gigas]